MKKLALIAGAVVMAAGISVQAWAADAFKVDTVHSSIGFSIAHMVVAQVAGGFNDYSGAIEFDPRDPASAKFDFIITSSSIDTRNEARDTHLKGSDFFDAAQFPTITFKSKRLVPKGGSDFTLIGDLTMKDVTKEVEWPITIQGPVANPMGSGQVLGVQAQFKINRQDYHVKWNKALDNGGVILGNDVLVNVAFEAHK